MSNKVSLTLENVIKGKHTCGSICFWAGIITIVLGFAVMFRQDSIPLLSNKTTATDVVPVSKSFVSTEVAAEDLTVSEESIEPFYVIEPPTDAAGAPLPGAVPLSSATSSEIPSVAQVAKILESIKAGDAKALSELTGLDVAVEDMKSVTDFYKDVLVIDPQYVYVIESHVQNGYTQVNIITYNMTVMIMLKESSGVFTVPALPGMPINNYISTAPETSTVTSKASISISEGSETPIK